MSRMGAHVRIFPQENISLPEQCQNVSNESFLAIFFPVWGIQSKLNNGTKQLCKAKSNFSFKNFEGKKEERKHHLKSFKWK